LLSSLVNLKLGRCGIGFLSKVQSFVKPGLQSFGMDSMELCIVTMLGIDTGTIDTDFSCFGLDLQ
jgi:hypothetical protein